MKEKKKRNRKRDERQTLEAPPAVEDPPVTPAVVAQGLRALDQIPRRQWSRLAWLFITEHTRQGQTLLGHVIDAIKFTRHADLESFMRQNWEVLRVPNPDNLPGLREWHPDAAIALLREQGFQCGGRKWYEKWRLRFGLLPCTACKPPRPYSVRAFPASS